MSVGKCNEDETWSFLCKGTLYRTSGKHKSPGKSPFGQLDNDNLKWVELDFGYCGTRMDHRWVRWLISTFFLNGKLN